MAANLRRSDRGAFGESGGKSLSGGWQKTFREALLFCSKLLVVLSFLKTAFLKQNACRTEKGLPIRMSSSCGLPAKKWWTSHFLQKCFRLFFVVGAIWLWGSWTKLQKPQRTGKPVEQLMSASIDNSWNGVRERKRRPLWIRVGIQVGITNSRAIICFFSTRAVADWGEFIQKFW